MEHKKFLTLSVCTAKTYQILVLKSKAKMAPNLISRKLKNYPWAKDAPQFYL